MVNGKEKYWRCTSKLQPHSLKQAMKTCVHRQLVVLAIWQFCRLLRRQDMFMNSCRGNLFWYTFYSQRSFGGGFKFSHEVFRLNGGLTCWLARMLGLWPTAASEQTWQSYDRLELYVQGKYWRCKSKKQPHSSCQEMKASAHR